jgi:hypothetical protein
MEGKLEDRCVEIIPPKQAQEPTPHPDDDEEDDE